MGKARVGILSMQRIYNYGSFLRAYGLKLILESLGCEVRFVDYESGRCLVDSGASKMGLAREAGEARLKADIAARMPLPLRVAPKRAKPALKGGRR